MLLRTAVDADAVFSPRSQIDELSQKRDAPAEPDRSRLLLITVSTAILWNAINIEVVKIRQWLPGPAFYIGDFATVLAIVLTYHRGLASEHSRRATHGVRRALMLVLFIAILSALWNGVSPWTALLGVRWVVYAWLGLSVGALGAPARASLMRSLPKVLVAFCIVVELPYGLWQLLSRQPLPAPEFSNIVVGLGTGVRAYGTLGWPTTLGDFLLGPIFVCAAIYKGRLRTMLLVGLLALLVITFSRGSLLALAVGFIVLTAAGTFGRSWLHARVVLGSLVGVALVLAVITGALGLTQRAHDLSLQNLHRGVVAGGRLGIADFAAHLVEIHPILGTGPGTFGGGVSVPTLASIDELAGAKVLTAESWLLQAAVELGLAGLSSVVLLFAVVLRQIRASPHHGVAAGYRGVALASTAALVVSSLSTVALLIRPVALSLWVLIGLGMVPATASESNFQK